MPVHKFLFGDRTKAATWLGFAAGKLKILGGKFASQAFRPRPGIDIYIRRVNKQEYIHINAELALYGYEFFSVHDFNTGPPADFGETTRHRFLKNTVDSESIELPNKPSIIPIPTDEDDLSPAFYNNPWYKGKTVVTGGLNPRYSVYPAIQLPPTVTDFSTGVRTEGPDDMLIMGAAINNGILVGIDRLGKVYAADSISKTATTVTAQLELPTPGLMEKIAIGELQEGLYPTFNKDGTKATTMVYFYRSSDDLPLGGWVMEYGINASRDENGNVLLAVETLQTISIPPGYAAFGSDYYSEKTNEDDDEPTEYLAVGARYVVGSVGYLNPQSSYLTVRNALDIHQVFMAVEFGGISWRFGDPTYIQITHTAATTAFDIRSLYYCIQVRSFGGGDRIYHAIEANGFYGEKARADGHTNNVERLDSGSRELPDLGWEQGPLVDGLGNSIVSDRDSLFSTGGLYGHPAHDNSWSAWAYIGGGSTWGLHDLELDVVRPYKRAKTTHRVMYNNLRAEQVATQADFILPVLPELTLNVAGEDPNMLTMISGAWYPKDN